MSIVDLLVRVADVFDARRIPFVLIGGMALATWVQPRLTRDVDIVVMVRRRDAPRLKAALIELGARVTALEMRLLFEGRFRRFKIDGALLDVCILSFAHDRAAYGRSEPTKYEGRAIRVAVPEDLVLYKLRAWRLQDQADIQRMLQDVPKLDRRYIESWLDRVAEDSGEPMRERWVKIQAEARSRG